MQSNGDTQWLVANGDVESAESGHDETGVVSVRPCGQGLLERRFERKVIALSEFRIARPAGARLIAEYWKRLVNGGASGGASGGGSGSDSGGVQGKGSK